ncbi:hypothetical protein LSTR_LSTR006164 [Laodelphax striatellus]|uniref:Uncharacterized protein n=1 Tax=Laodelphax striatellus TaxID=195883 RepID=A0A482XRL7_LAOST|nr:hypothetical protein LSTR_LSTR006164 [Laodelphax striatellus]
MSRPLCLTDSDYCDKIQRLLNNYADDELDGSSSEEDDSKKDPDFVLPNAEVQPHIEVLQKYTLSSSTESDPGTGTDDEQEVSREALTEEVNILPDYYIERMKKQEFGPPNAWSSRAPATQVRVPERNIIRTGLPGI